MVTSKKQSSLYTSISKNLPFIRPIYRSLLAQKKVYAAFDRKQVQTILEKLAPSGTVLDPMSGYGGLSTVCRELGIATYCIENNPPSYLWQILNEPSNKEE